MHLLCLKPFVLEYCLSSSAVSLRMSGIIFVRVMFLSGKKPNIKVASSVGRTGEGGMYERFYLGERKLIMDCTSRSQSRMKGEYLFYEEKVETTEEERQAKAARR